MYALIQEKFPVLNFILCLLPFFYTFGNWDEKFIVGNENKYFIQGRLV
jgi:hypothetical protein